MYNKYEQDKLVSLLQKKQEIKNIHGIDMLVKNIPDVDIDGDLDPRVKEKLKDNAKNMKDMSNIEPPKSTGDIPVEFIRSIMGSLNFDISRGIDATDKIIQGRNGNIPLRVYTSNKNESMPAIVFIHGGAFFGGSTKTVENACKYLAQKIEGVVVSVDYRLCPEYRFPQGLHDCFDTVKWLYENSKELNVNCNNIGVSGDSSGGNYSTVCSMMDRDLGTKMIKFQALLYPGLNLSEDKIEDYEFDIKLYNIKNNYELIEDAVMGIKKFPPLSLLYVNNPEEISNPYVSPLISSSLKHMPQTLIITAEYDYLTLEAEAYARKLIRDKVPTKLIRYNGIDHAFIDKIGIYPQAQDCIDEIAKEFKIAIR
ncbi:MULTISPECIES: alpha/beta hydrolase [Clostridium]|uniref:Alpha/beta hydrolase n=1 Tax=Clostridium frigoriphilum TaxID=443253 RepID=A0ABU7UPF1_9CLOT|nr:alpha/beta hydrolase [Clostridium sp. DSM 17811]MBU3099487.1 alpha/beta hydrolase [Clostridium sp. DSM 17811]